MLSVVNNSHFYVRFLFFDKRCHVFDKRKYYIRKYFL